ncbi:hypothetical protein [Pseudothermotoga sp.]|uniref:hypothetical protein n=1 Tax=Pseudothermotoga sp. TaxID=2033661 RepID=UPI0031F6878D
MKCEGWQRYREDVEKLCDWLWNRYKRFILSKEDLVQTGYYLLLLALESYEEGRMKEKSYVLWYVRKKLLNMLFGGENAPKHNGYPFTFVKDRNSKVKINFVEEESLEKCIDLF